MKNWLSMGHGQPRIREARVPQLVGHYCRHGGLDGCRTHVVAGAALVAPAWIAEPGQEKLRRLTGNR
jgi:hypothetical protein